MADMTTGMVSAPAQAGPSISAGKLVNIAGAALSLALIAGAGLWGYKLIVRDASGIPVVRALEGDMRVPPENPGGEIAVHTGLSVNTVAAEGGAAEPEDRLVLAPGAPELPQEDLDVAPMAERDEAAVPRPAAESEVEVALELDEPGAPRVLADDAAPVADPDAPLTPEDILAIADEIAAGSSPLSDLAEGEDTPVQVAVNGVAADEAPAVDVIPASVPGVARSPRPEIRPATARPASASPAAPAASAAGPVELTGALPAGTTLVQLGAHASPEVAAREWARLQAAFPDFIAGKERVIQEATSGGRTFYRLRALGYADHADASRFCAALVAEGERCIPVVVR